MLKLSAFLRIYARFFRARGAGKASIECEVFFARALTIFVSSARPNVSNNTKGSF